MAGRMAGVGAGMNMIGAGMNVMGAATNTSGGRTNMIGAGRAGASPSSRLPRAISLTWATQARLSPIQILTGPLASPPESDYGPSGSGYSPPEAHYPLEYTGKPPSDSLYTSTPSPIPSHYQYRASDYRRSSSSQAPPTPAYSVATFDSRTTDESALDVGDRYQSRYHYTPFDR
ncbi:hypothetical protein BD626DRAFT_516315 [Schizophyllum amplum]|uniref:Uncharacterized protein n=1 Tax=Schizophyllum amplum TaxID=97359 RepID=A0A550BX10_9AGAR|nr:hypothetical protein BD626DRAFT_516315 [Auriculariopsis ampla]